MAYSYEGVLTHSNRKIELKKQYIDCYGETVEISFYEHTFMGLDCIKNREPLLIFRDNKKWSIRDFFKEEPK